MTNTAAVARALADAVEPGHHLRAVRRPAQGAAEGVIQPARQRRRPHAADAVHQRHALGCADHRGHHPQRRRRACRGGMVRGGAEPVRRGRSAPPPSATRATWCSPATTSSTPPSRLTPNGLAVMVFTAHRLDDLPERRVRGAAGGRHARSARRHRGGRRPGPYDPNATAGATTRGRCSIPSGTAFWLATEYMPPKASQTTDGQAQLGHPRARGVRLLSGARSRPVGERSAGSRCATASPAGGASRRFAGSTTTRARRRSRARWPAGSARRWCSATRSRAGEHTSTARQRARDTATFMRLREYRNSMPRGTSSASDVAIE